MFNVIKKSIQWGGETLTLETGKIARQADGHVIDTLGEIADKNCYLELFKYLDKNKVDKATEMDLFST